jgi:hypothetical protein
MGMATEKEMSHILKNNKTGKIRQWDVLPYRNNDKLTLASRDKCSHDAQFFP